MFQLPTLCIWRRMLIYLLIGWIGFVAPNLAQAERVCDALSHETIGAIQTPFLTADETHEITFHAGDAHHTQHGHCHSPLAHDQVDTTRGWSAAIHIYSSTVSIWVDSRYRSHVPALFERPPKV